MSDLYACIEAGGTKFVCAIIRGDGEMIAEARIATTTPEETLAQVADFFVGQEKSYRATGIASFGPLDLAPASPTFGRLAKTPKPGWSGVDLLGWARTTLGAPAAIDTDVAAAALAESIEGAGAGCASVVYVTVGTGIGGGIALGQSLPADGVRPEMGHIFPRRHPGDLDFAGICPFHGDCLEGLASGVAIEARWGAPLSELPADHPAHAVIAYYLGTLCHQIIALLNPDRIVLGGGVMKTAGLIERVRDAANDLERGYSGAKASGRIVEPGLRDRSGIEGARLLAERASKL